MKCNLNVTWRGPGAVCEHVSGIALEKLSYRSFTWQTGEWWLIAVKNRRLLSKKIVLTGFYVTLTRQQLYSCWTHETESLQTLKSLRKCIWKMSRGDVWKLQITAGGNKPDDEMTLPDCLLKANNHLARKNTDFPLRKSTVAPPWFSEGTKC